jgi:hypothetical protein
MVRDGDSDQCRANQVVGGRWSGARMQGSNAGKLQNYRGAPHVSQ